jgi:hypothetical protein
LGTSQAIASPSTNEFHFNYSRSRANAFDALDSFGHRRYASDLLQLEPLRPGHLEGHTHVDNHIWPAVGVRCRTLRRQRQSSVYPRLGVAWQPLPSLVLRTGAGIFYDLGYSAVANVASSFPYVQGKTVLNTSFPRSAPAAAPPPFTTAPPVAAFMAVVDPKHVLPRTYEWNAAVEKTFGRADALTVTYLGAAGRKLMRTDDYNTPNPNFTAEFQLMRNDADSSYQALQAQFRHRLAHGLQTLLSYTWAHAIDDASSDSNYLNVPLGDSTSERGSSDYDIPAHVLRRSFL